MRFVDDLNTPVALAALHELATKANKAAPQTASAARNALLAGGWLLGLLQEDPETYFQGADTADADSAAIDALIAERNAARKARNFQRADAIRDELAAQGIELEDLREGTRWRRV